MNEAADSKASPYIKMQDNDRSNSAMSMSVLTENDAKSRDVSSYTTKSFNLTPEQKHNRQVDKNVEEWEKSILSKFYSVFVLFVIMFGQIGNQMEQGMINPAFQYPVLTPFFWIGSIMGNNPVFMYGILIGPAFIVPLIISSFVAGVVSEHFNRKTVMSLAVIVWSATLLVTGFAQEVYTVLVMRIVLGFTIGFFVPPAISLIIDYFPANRQTTAMGLFALAESLSDGLTSFATIVIAGLGWRKTYIVFSTIFIGIGLVGLAAIKEPIRQRFTYINKQVSGANQHAHAPTGSISKIFKDFSSILQVPCINWNLAATFFKFAGNTSVMGFSLFLINRYNKIEEFALISLALNFAGGIFANMFYAWICDTYEPKYIKIKSYVAMFNMLVATFCYFFAFFFFRSFGMLVIFIAIEEFFGEGSAAPSLSMMTLTAPRGTEASVIGLFVISSGLGTIVMSLILGDLVAEGDPLAKIMTTMTWSTVPCFAAAAFCFFMSQFDYAETMTKLKEARQAAAAMSQRTDSMNETLLVPNFGAAPERLDSMNGTITEAGNDVPLKLVKSGALRYTTGFVFAEQHKSDSQFSQNANSFTNSQQLGSNANSRSNSVAAL